MVSPGPLHPARGRHLGAAGPRRRGTGAGARRVPRPPGHRRGVRRSRGAGRPAHAREDHAWWPHRGHPLFEGVPVAVRGHALPLARRLARGPAARSWRSPRGPTTGPTGTEIMALSHRSLPVFGVQFHPESVGTAAGQADPRELPRTGRLAHETPKPFLANAIAARYPSSKARGTPFDSTPRSVSFRDARPGCHSGSSWLDPTPQQTAPAAGR